MLQYVLPTLNDIFSLSSLTFLILGMVLGLIFGILPGLGGPQVLALLFPVTFTMDPAHAITLLMAAAAASPLGGSVTAILLNTPGTPANAATVYDGYPLTLQGKSGLAIGAATSASVMGGILGAVILTLILPFGRYLVLAFSYAEYFMMALMGMVMVALVSKGNMLRGITAASLGVMLSLVGYDPITGSTRFTFGTDYLMDGIQLIPALVGLFAIAESIELFIGKSSISQKPVNTSLKGVKEGIFSVFKHFDVFLKGSTIGTIIGIIPGVGGAVANFVAYAQVATSSKNNENFGKGDIRGVIAPEAANNAKDGGSLVPTLVFGIPGNLETAILLGALTLHGIVPGPRMLTENGNLILILIYTLVLANIFAGIVVALSAGPLSRITAVKTTYIAPGVMVFALMGVYASNVSIIDVVVAFLFGILGFAMHRYHFSRVPLVIGMILGVLLQSSYFQTVKLFGYSGFFNRPISLTLFLIIVLMLVFPMIHSIRKKGV